ncbi:DoxX family membrane protein [Silicimonas algicola]|uniref:DoxX family membrane protein n=1 Tax=Silicimonas algicola TaxID=1826607 RepID=UPI000D6CB0A0|nr:DoxX family membrane protein [Silicimonas algicola]AZQ69560.1 DoxX family membrane protein [Silicimonas algicola]
MQGIVSLHDRVFAGLEKATIPVMTTLARFVFAAVLLVYYWKSALTKLGDGPAGLLAPSAGAYAQIFPKTFEAAGYDVSQLGVHHWAIATLGTWAELVLPLLLLLGLFTRLAALSMIGFVVVQTVTDLFGHGGIAHDGTLGAWFDGMPDSIVLDQRAFWVFALLYLVFRGGGPLSVDRFLRNATSARRGVLPQAQGERPARTSMRERW